MLEIIDVKVLIALSIIDTRKS